MLKQRQKMQASHSIIILDANRCYLVLFDCVSCTDTYVAELPKSVPAIEMIVDDTPFTALALYI